MAGIDAPYRDPREEMARAMQQAARPAPVAPAAAVPAVAPIPTGDATPLDRVPKDFAKSGIKVPGQSTIGGRVSGGVNAVLDADVSKAGKAVASGAKAAGSATATGARAALGSVTRGIGRLTVPLTAGMQAYQTATTDTEDYYRRTGIEPEATVVPQVVKDIGVRALGTLQDIGNNVTFGVADRVGNLIAGNGFTRSEDNGQQIQDKANRTVGGDLPAPPQPGTGFNDRRFDAAQGITPPETGVIRFDPATKTYSGTDVKAGATIAGGRPGGRGSGRGSVNSLDTSEGYASDIAQLQTLRAERAEREAGFAGNQPGGGLAGIADPRQTAQPSTEDRVRELMRAGLSNRQALAAVNQERSAATQAQAGERSAAVQARGQDIGRAQAVQQQRQQAGIARMQDQTQRDIAVLNASRPTAAAGPRFTAVNLPDSITADGQTIRGGQALLNNQTGEIVYPGQQRQQFVQGQVYTDANGNRATWDGQKFVPVR